jgi:hypothetical protein
VGFIHSGLSYFRLGLLVRLLLLGTSLFESWCTGAALTEMLKLNPLQASLRHVGSGFAWPSPLVSSGLTKFRLSVSAPSCLLYGFPLLLHVQPRPRTKICTKKATQLLLVIAIASSTSHPSHVAYLIASLTIHIHNPISQQPFRNFPTPKPKRTVPTGHTKSAMVNPWSRDENPVIEVVIDILAVRYLDVDDVIQASSVKCAPTSPQTPPPIS